MKLRNCTLLDAFCSQATGGYSSRNPNGIEKSHLTLVLDVLSAKRETQVVQTINFTSLANGTWLSGEVRAEFLGGVLGETVSSHETLKGLKSKSQKYKIRYIPCYWYVNRVIVYAMKGIHISQTHQGLSRSSQQDIRFIINNISRMMSISPKIPIYSHPWMVVSLARLPELYQFW